MPSYKIGAKDNDIRKIERHVLEYPSDKERKIILEHKEKYCIVNFYSINGSEKEREGELVYSLSNKEAKIQNFIIFSEQLRGKGLGTKIYQKTEEELKKKGVKRVSVTVHRTKAIDFWKHVNYEHTGKLKLEKLLCEDTA